VDEIGRPGVSLTVENAIRYWAVLKVGKITVFKF